MTTGQSSNPATQYAVSDLSEESDRLEVQAEHLSAIMKGQVLHSPIDPSKIRRALDIGSGTGWVAHYLGTLLPHTDVVGLDIGNLPRPRAYPPNARFFQGNALSQPPSSWTPVPTPRLETDGADQSHLQSGAATNPDTASFDLIFTRLILDLMPDWPRLIETSFSLLRPGGWSEHHELDLVWYNSSNDVISDSWTWWQKIRSFGLSSNLDFMAGSHVQHKMLEIGFVDVQVKEYYWPSGGQWEKSKEWKAFGEYVQSSLPGIFGRSLEMAMAGQPADEIAKMRAEMLRDLQPEEGKHWKFYVTCGRKQGK
jgi:SAM-dependent methyltransferase